MFRLLGETWHGVPRSLNSYILSGMVVRLLIAQTDGEGCLGIVINHQHLFARFCQSEVSLVNAMSRETILRQYLDTVRRQYTHILIDCQPSLGMLTINALAAPAAERQSPWQNWSGYPP